MICSASSNGLLPDVDAHFDLRGGCRVKNNLILEQPHGNVEASTDIAQPMRRKHLPVSVSEVPVSVSEVHHQRLRSSIKAPAGRMPNYRKHRRSW